MKVTIRWTRAFSSTCNPNPICVSLAKICEIQNSWKQLMGLAATNMIWDSIGFIDPLSSPGTGWHKSSHRSHNVARTEWAVHFIWELKHTSWSEPALCTSSPPQRARWWMYTDCIPDHEHLSIVQFRSYLPHHLVALEGRRIVFPILVKDWALYTCAQLIAPSTNWSWR